ncbi:lysis system i-spanin subunit Rz [Herbaspirillum sp.]|uniref:lysis system i-spanin subunit Rz n=1 Tax=Herbaspirillum sp. TaxID=1890675 RepID=UPI001B24BCB2|nr:lysis system i-spanin subunit Rz [Herbaspirillum sp.]MBO9538740.1 lysis protein [Herbaspirillum sp.]
MKNPLIIISLLIALAYAVFRYGEHEYSSGQKAENSLWQEKENATLTRANKRIKELEEQARADEAKHAKNMSAISTQYQKDLKNERLAKDRFIAAVRSGELRLYDPAAGAANSNGAGGNQTCSTDASAGGRDGATRGQLSKPASEFLLSLAGEADEVVHQLTACQAVVAADRKMKEQE